MNSIIKINIENNVEEDEEISLIEDLCINSIPLREIDIDKLLNNLCYEIRKRIAEYENDNMFNYSFSYKCDLAQSMIYYYLEELNISSKPVNTNEILTDAIGHSLVIADFKTNEGDKQYIIDPTYIQFFTKEGCDKNRFIIINNIVCATPDPGYFILKSKQENIIMPLLNKGYIEFTDNIAKVYGDSFYKTKTNNLYNQIEHNVASGKLYKKWFNSYTAKLSKTKDQLKEMNLLINKKSNEELRKKR